MSMFGSLLLDGGRGLGIGTEAKSFVLSHELHEFH